MMDHKTRNFIVFLLLTSCSLAYSQQDDPIALIGCAGAYAVYSAELDAFSSSPEYISTLSDSIEKSDLEMESAVMMQFSKLSLYMASKSKPKSWVDLQYKNEIRRRKLIVDKLDSSIGGDKSLIVHLKNINGEIDLCYKNISDAYGGKMQIVREFLAKEAMKSIAEKNSRGSHE